MSSFDKTKVTGEYKTILRRKFGALYDWEKPMIIETVGPFDPSAFDNFADRLDTMLIAAIGLLEELDVPDLAVL